MNNMFGDDDAASQSIQSIHRYSDGQSYDAMQQFFVSGNDLNIEVHERKQASNFNSSAQ